MTVKTDIESFSHTVKGFVLYRWVYKVLKKQFMKGITLANKHVVHEIV